MKKLLLIVLLLVWAASLAGCASMAPGGGKPMSFADMTPKQKYIAMGSFYKAQYDLYKARQDQPLDDAERQVMRARYEVLNGMKPLLDLYGTYISTGMVPPVDLLEKLYPLYLRLIDLAGKEA